MLRNLLHFSDHDADDVAIPRVEIIAVDAAPPGTSWSRCSPNMDTRGCRSIARRSTR